jgi:hypothetical protein
MQTIQFQCGHCRNVMAVNTDYLGKQVRCPHCQQVVLAPNQAPAPAAVPNPAPALAPPPPPPGPAPAPAPPPGPALTTPAPRGFPGGDDQDSIFGEHIDEDLFGGLPKSKVELPPEPLEQAKPNLMLEPTVFQVPGLTTPTVPIPSSPAQAAPSPPPAPEMAPTETVMPSPAAAPDPLAGTLRPSLRRTEGNVMVTSLLIILIPYSILVTVIALILYFNQQRQIHPLEMLPDLGNPPAKRVAGNPLPILEVSGSYRRTKPDEPLPGFMITTLGQPLQIGDLEVTPLEVMQKHVLFKWRSTGFKPELSEHEALVLKLQLKNISKDVEFRPMDLSFDHKFKDDGGPRRSQMPYTYLELPTTGKRYCGPFEWNRGAQIKLPSHLAGAQEYVDGQEEHNKLLKPGEEMQTVIITDPNEQVPNALRNYRGKLLWRVQLRRGIVKYKEKDHSVTAVIGVQFDTQDIVRK